MGNTKERDGLVLCFHRFCPASGLGFSSGRMNMNGPHLSCHQRLGDLDTYVAFLPIEDRRRGFSSWRKWGVLLPQIHRINKSQNHWLLESAESLPVRRKGSLHDVYAWVLWPTSHPPANSPNGPILMHPTSQQRARGRKSVAEGLFYLNKASGSILSITKMRLRRKSHIQGSPGFPSCQEQYMHSLRILNRSPPALVTFSFEKLQFHPA